MRRQQKLSVQRYVHSRVSYRLIGDRGAVMYLVGTFSRHFSIITITRIVGRRLQSVISMTGNYLSTKTVLLLDRDYLTSGKTAYAEVANLWYKFWIMDNGSNSASHQELLHDKEETLLRIIYPNVLLVTLLTEHDWLDDYTEQMITAERTNIDRNRRLLDWLKRSPREAFDGFLRALRANGQGHVANYIDGSPGESRKMCSLCISVRC